MSAKIFLALCAQALFVQIAISQCTSRTAIDASYGNPLGWTGLGLAFDALPASIVYDGIGRTGKGVACDGIHSVVTALDFTPTSGGGLVVTSGSPIAPTGISVVSDNAFEGALSVAGEVPFVGTTAVDGLLPASGAGAINHACGDGVTTMISEVSAFGPETSIAVEPVAIVPTTAAISPASVISTAAVNPTAPLTARPGLGLGNRFGHRGCGNRGLMY